MVAGWPAGSGAARALAGVVELEEGLTPTDGTVDCRLRVTGRGWAS